MSYDGTHDDLVDGLCAIARTEVTAALAPAFGADHPAVRAAVPFPIPLDQIGGSSQLPLMAIWVEREAEVRTTSRYVDARLTVAFEFFAQATPIAKLAARWPTLRKTWRALLDAIAAGTVGTVEVLAQLGVIEIDVEAAVVDYDYAADGSSAYPHFLGRIGITVRPVDTTTLADLRELFAKINGPDNLAIQRVEVLARTEAGVIANEGSGDPLDPDSEDA